MKALERVRVLLLMIPLTIPLSLVLPGCGGGNTPTSGSNTSTIKTPDEILKEAQAKDAAAKTAPK
jgi:hypothetical protein